MKPKFIWSANENGLAVRFSSARRFQKAQKGQGDKTDRFAYIRMQMLVEPGDLDVEWVDNGIFIAAPAAVRLAPETREGFHLPPTWPGGFRMQTESVPHAPDFRVRIALVDATAYPHWNWRLRGPILEAAGEDFLPSAEQYAALKALTDWRRIEERDEVANLSLLASLREAWRAGCRIDLETYRDHPIVEPGDISVDVREGKNGDLVLRPVLEGNFPAPEPDEIEQRYGQLEQEGDRAILRVGSTIILLKPEQTRIAREIAKRGRVTRSQKKEFKKNPSKWLADNDFPDEDAKFSPRVKGIDTWTPGYLGAAWEDSEDWFDKKAGSPPSAREPSPGEGESKDPPPQSDDSTDPDSAEDRESIPDSEPLVPLIIPNDEELGFGWRFPELSGENRQTFVLDVARYSRPPERVPKPYQVKAVKWILGNAQRALQRSNGNPRPLKSNEKSAPGFGAGVLLADDMGLGKTYTTLIFLGEWFRLWRRETDKEPPAVLVVAPLSLLENWKEEIEKTYRPDDAVFTRILVAQSDADLDKVRRGPGSRDEAEPGKVTSYGLGFGDQTERSIDYPGGCVLTTYQTLRQYRFSFAKAEWSAAVFDEAQNIKNPNALQTISAKALKAIFRIALTGTPVENHLGDFWSIIDTVEPGPKLGSFAQFRKQWIVKMAREAERRKEIGKELRDHIGGLMLRRTKEEQLEDLPKKKIVSVEVSMTSEQKMAYDSVISAAHRESKPEEDERQRQNRQLAALWQLRQVSLHPALLEGGEIPDADSPKSARAVLSRSGKLAWLLKELDRIRDVGERNVGEKVLIFCVQKKLQEKLALHLGQIYGLPVPVINGDTKTTSKRDPQETRLGLIRTFSELPGFGVCILSPIAAGAGLNIQAANHVIHLERHWNPAKEDQATDRVYRIGQERPVTVYLPTGIHPKLKSFDLLLNGLLEKKRALQGHLGLVPPETVTGPEIIREVFGETSHESSKSDDILDLKAALNLSWKLFEALIAVLYKPEAERVILTPSGSDCGCDVVVLGWGRKRENLLIQCKTTKHSKLDSAAAVREIEGSRLHYENSLGTEFKEKVVHTTAKKFSKNTRNVAKTYQVSLRGRSWLADQLGKKKITRSKVLVADRKREPNSSK